jgi:hypothetical protein
MRRRDLDDVAGAEIVDRDDAADLDIESIKAFALRAGGVYGRGRQTTASPRLAKYLGGAGEIDPK